MLSTVRSLTNELVDMYNKNINMSEHNPERPIKRYNFADYPLRGVDYVLTWCPYHKDCTCSWNESRLITTVPTKEEHDAAIRAEKIHELFKWEWRLIESHVEFKGKYDFDKVEFGSERVLAKAIKDLLIGLIWKTVDTDELDYIIGVIKRVQGKKVIF